MDELINTNYLLEQILLELQLQNIELKSKYNLKFNEEFLNSDNKKEVYSLIDGLNDSDAISNMASCSARTVRRIIKDFEDLDLIEVKKDGKFKIPNKSRSKIINYYINNSEES